MREHGSDVPCSPDHPEVLTFQIQFGRSLKQGIKRGRSRQRVAARQGHPSFIDRLTVSGDDGRIASQPEDGDTELSSQVDCSADQLQDATVIPAAQALANLL